MRSGRKCLRKGQLKIAIRYTKEEMMRCTIILIFTCLSCSFSFAQDQKVIDEIIAVVGDEIAIRSELESQLAQYKSQGYPVTSETACQLMEELLFQKLLLNQAKVDSVEVSEAQVDSELDRRMRYFISQIGSKEALEKYYDKSVSMIKEEMRQSLKDQLLIQQMQSRIVGDVKITPSEVQDYYDKIPEDSIPLINSTVEMEEIVAYAPLSKEAKQSTINRLKELRERVLNGEKFSTLAVLYSEDLGSSKKGGEIGFVGKAEVEPEFAAAAFDLKPGNVSPVIETRYGFHIIEMIERRGEKVNVRHILIKPKIENKAFEQAQEKLDSIALLIMADSLTFSEAAVKFSEREESKNNGGLIVNPYSGSSKVEMDQLDIALFAAVDKLEVGEISEPVLLTDAQSKPGYRLIRLKSRTLPHKANLQDDYQKIKDAALSNKESLILDKWLEDVVPDSYIRINDEYAGCQFNNKWIYNEQ